MYHQPPRGRARGRGYRGHTRGYQAPGRGRGAGSGFGPPPPPAPPYHLPLPLEPHPANVEWTIRLADGWKANGRGASALKHLLWEAFSSTSQPFLRMLDLVIFSPDYSKHRPDGATALVLNVFRSYVCDTFGSVESVHTGMLNEKVKRLAFKALYNQECSAVGDAIVEVCDLAGSELFVEEIHRMVAAREYKKACQMATRLNLNANFAPESFLLPLVLQDRANLVDSFLVLASERLQRATVAAVDAMMDRSLNAVASELGMASYARETVNQKSLKRLVERLCRQLKLPIREAAPGAALAAARAQLNFVLYRRFREASVRPDDCEDFLQEILAYYPDLIQGTLERLCSEGALRTAYKLAEALSVPSYEMPLSLEDIFYRQAPCPETDRDQAAKSGPSPLSPAQYYKLPLGVQVQLVNSCDQLPQVIYDLEAYTGPLGLDAEWRPVSVREWIGCSLLQVATERHVYVLDLLGLDVMSQLMKRLGSAILCGDNLKLGYDVTSDFDMLEQSVPAFSDAIHNKKNMMDIKILASRVETAFPDLFPFREEPASSQDGSGSGSGSGGKRQKPKEAHKGLSELVRKCLGRPLDKGEQCSNWERRPLRQSQLQYAACDAHCLIAVHAVLTEQLQRHHGTTPRQVLQCIVTSSDGGAAAGADRKQPADAARRKKTPGPKPPELENAPAPNQRAIRTEQFRTVCDTMVQGLGKKLRSIGADTVILENGDDHDLCVDLCRREDRVILTRGRALHWRMAGLVPQGYCYRVLAERATDQLDEVVRHFKLDVAPDDVFKRCQHCNSGDYWRVPTAVMRRLQRRENCGWVPLEGFGATHVHCATGQIRDCELTVRAHAVRDTTLESVDTFYVCQGCGHVYWAGSHHDRYVANLGNILRTHRGEGASAPPYVVVEEVTAGLGMVRMPSDTDSGDDYDTCFL